MTPLRIAFMGTPDFAVPALHVLHQAGHEIVAVYCQPPKPAGRGQQLRPSAVQAAAEALGLPIRTPKTLRDTEAQVAFEQLALDIAVVAAYGLILPMPVLTAPRLGCINIHGSLLPRWRGAAPIQRAILAGDAETGVTIMQMEAGLDTGPMLLKQAVPITPQTSSASLFEDLSMIGARLAVQAVTELAAGNLKPEIQPVAGVTHAAKLTREEGRIDWHESANEIERRLRALNPWPGCSFTAGGESIKLLSAEIVTGSGDAAPGTLLDADFTVACGKDSLRLTKVQRAGKPPTDGAAYLRGYPLPPGQIL